ncbi:MAG: glycosyltransferase family 4 protein [Elusimicrobia bacterium]|nr:glycosyltransferase family 4 protein [Elusimicrobiota bacterium]
MRIAQVAPLYESVPPRLYGGTERVVSYLTEALVRMGHDVTLFASADSSTRAKLVPMRKIAMRLDAGCEDQIAWHIIMVEKVAQMAAQFDVIHFHIDHLQLPVARRINTPTVTTLHGRLNMSDLQPLYREFSEVPVVSISDDQRRPLPFANWQGTVHHGLPMNLYTPGGQRERFLAFLGRVSPEKGLDVAISIAQRAGWPIKIAAKIDPRDSEYYEHIKPMLTLPHVEFLGEVGEDGKLDLLRRAAGLLFPINWPEPFGLVMIEAMACGTPIIAYPRGSVPEVIDHGRTGFVVNNADEAVAAVPRLAELDTAEIRRTFERRFSAERMARDYVSIYKRLAGAMERELVPNRVPHRLEDGSGLAATTV